MTKQEKRKGGGAKMSRSETVTIRLDPKLRYLAELAALRQRRTLSSFIEWAISDSLKRVYLYEDPDGNHIYDKTVADEADLYDPYDPDRFAKLALHYPDLLNHEELKRWKLIRENGFLWRRRCNKENKWTWEINEESLLFDRLRMYWVNFCSVARGDASERELPKWETQKSDESDCPF